jgi:hypothetical protein
VEVWIHPYLIEDIGLRTVAWIDGGLGGKMGNDSRKAVD